MGLNDIFQHCRGMLLALIAALAVSGPATAEPTLLELVQTIPLKGTSGRLDHLALDAKGGRVFIANLSNNSLDVIDLKAGKLARQILYQNTIQGVAYAPRLNRIFVGNGADGVCRVFDGRDYRLLKSIPLPDADNVRYDADKELIYVTHAEKALSAIDARTYAVKGTIQLPGPAEAFQFDPTEARIYVNTHQPGQVTVIARDIYAVISNHPLKAAEANFPLALDVKNQRIFVGCRKKPAIVVLDAKTGKELTAIDIAGDIDDLFYDGKRKRLYATCGEGFITVIQQKDTDRFDVVAKIPVPKLTRTCLFDPAGDRLYVPVPRQADAAGPTLRIYRPRD